MGINTLLLVLSPVLLGAIGTVPLDARPAALTQCTIVVSIFPSAGTVVGNLVSLRTGVNSSCQVASVVATAPGGSVPLSFSQSSGVWIGDVDVSALPHGPFTLSVTATDVFGTVGTQSVSLVHDTRPTLVITAPEVDALSRGILRVAATCQDDAPTGCASVNVRVSTDSTSSSGTVVATGVSSVDQRLLLTALLTPSSRNQVFWITFAGFDSRSQRTEVKRRVYLEDNGRLVEVLRVAGTIIDDAADRTLFTDATRVALLDKTTQQVTTLFTGQGLSITCGSITSTGAIFQNVSSLGGSTESRLYQWHAGQLLDLDLGGCPKVKGEFAIWKRSVSLGPDPLFRKNLSTGETITVDHDAEDPFVASNGDVVYWIFNPNTGVWRYRDGTRTNLVGSTTEYRAVSPVTDGLNVAYLRIQAQGGSELQSWLITTAGEIVLDPEIGGAGTYSPRDYAVANGWTAFTRRANSSRNVWTRSPDGEQTQRTFFGDGAGVAALDDDGRLAVHRDQRLYVVEPAGAVRDVGFQWSPVWWRNGRLYVAVGRSLMQVLDCAPALSATTANVGAGASGRTVTVTAASGCRWDAFSNSPFITVTSSAASSGNATVAFTVGANESTQPRTGSVTIAGQVFTVTQGPVTMAVSPSALRFSATRRGDTGGVIHVTPEQVVTVDTPGAAPVWTVTANAPWVRLAPGSGTGPAVVNVAINGFLLPAGATTLVATVTVRATLSGATSTFPVTLTVRGGTSVPFGQVDTPNQGVAGVQGAIGVTGWALDDIGVAGVKIFRNCLNFEDPANCQTVLGYSVVFVGDAAVLDGARPDVEAAFNSYPENNRAGWGFLMLTSMLPHVTHERSYGGHGPLTLYAVATDVEGNQTLLGRSSDPASAMFATPTSITMANDSIAKPFGAIDTPAQGATVSGVLNNFGWALTPDSNTTGGEVGDILIPTNGSTMTVFIDGLPTALVTYNQCRGNVGNPVPAGVFCNDDVANIFGNSTPQAVLSLRTANATRYRNLDAGRAAIGSFTIDTATLSNGLHTIAWSVTDSANRTEGIGSRFFNVLNAGRRAIITVW